MGDIKFTGTTVREVAARVKAITDGRFELQGTGSDIGNGTRYFDQHTQTVWLGPQGAREAVCYYIGGALETVRLTDKEFSADDMEYLMRVYRACTEDGPLKLRKRCLNWEEQGRERTRLAVESG